MAEVIEFDPVDSIGAGAFGRPGERTFLIQARKGTAQLSVLVEKEQVALLAAEAAQFLDRIAHEYPDAVDDAVDVASKGGVEEAEPLFRAQMIGLGYDIERALVLVELRETASDDDEDEPEAESDEVEGRVVRLYATRAQVRAMVESGAAAVTSGRPRCPLCDFPMDPDGHQCPRWN
jgi:uncharacterized repeat protein (TIGR03847 family)